MSLVLSAFGLAVLIYRLGFKSSGHLDVAANLEMPHVTIVVPARDEEENLTTLLPSLKALDYANFDVVVVDDGSTDKTMDVASTFGVTVIEAGPKPTGWVGKNWACARGAEIAKGDFILFTDADTRHRKDSLTKVVAFARSRHAGLVTAPPFHLAPTWW
ncbi:MAG: glycosyltransferase family A protein, partial [Bdellovibrionota bacterium]